MSDMKCPFCQQELEDANIHSAGLYFECPNCYEKQKEKDDNYTATPKVWQELIRTRKALDVAKERLKNTILDAEILATPEYLASRAKETLDEITALEQKDVK